MNILNFGSCCIDQVYKVPHFVLPGETLTSNGFDTFPGGKGLNQSIALARAGASVRHAGKVGSDGIFLKALMDEAGVDTSRVMITDSPSGHAIIQVTPEGENAIVIHGGSNREITPADFDSAFAETEAGDLLLLQNEVSHLDDIFLEGIKRGLKIAFNAAPMTQSVLSLPLQEVEFLIVNEIEASALADTDSTDPEVLLEQLIARFPKVKIVLTLGAAGAIYAHVDKRIAQTGISVSAVDTTGAGDTFTGYFLAGVTRGDPIETCLADACLAASVSVTAPGAASSIPHRSDLGQ